MFSQVSTDTYNFRSKIQDFRREIARKQRQQIFARIRKQFDIQTDCPFQSSTFQNFWDIQFRDIYKHIDEINETIFNLEKPDQLDEDETSHLCHDLIILLSHHRDQFQMPYGFKFFKNQSPQTASVAASCFTALEDEELNYWMCFMDEETKNLMYLEISCQDTFDRWVSNIDFMDHLIHDWGNVEEAESLVLELIRTIEERLNPDDDCFYESAFQRIHEMRKEKQFKLTKEKFLILVHILGFYLPVNGYHDREREKRFGYLRMLLNQSLIQAQKNEKDYKFSRYFVAVCAKLSIMVQELDYLYMLFTSEGFGSLCDILCKDFNKEFEGNSIDEVLENEKNYKKLKHQYISDLLDICLSYLRISRAFKEKERVPESMIQLIDANRDRENQKQKKNFQAILNLNSFTPLKQPKTQIMQKIQLQSPSNQSFQRTSIREIEI